MSRTLNYADWDAEGVALFGEDRMTWQFKCPSCGHIATPRDWKDAGAPDGAVAFSCVGRWNKADDSKTFKQQGGPCQYAGGGLFRLDPVHVQDEDGRVYEVFEFSPPSPVGEGTRKAGETGQ